MDKSGSGIQPPQINVFVQPPPQIPQVNQVEEQVTCSICTENIEHPCELRCKHAYHGKCIDQWFSSLERQGMSPTCPNCRSNITEQDYRKVRIASIDDEYNPDDDENLLHPGQVNFEYQYQPMSNFFDFIDDLENS